MKKKLNHVTCASLSSAPPTQRLPHLGAQGIPGPCPQLVGLGLCHVCPFLGIIQLVLGLAVLSQVGTGLLLLEPYAEPCFPLVTKMATCSHPQKEVTSPGPPSTLPVTSLPLLEPTQEGKKWRPSFKKCLCHLPTVPGLRIETTHFLSPFYSCK